MKDLCISAESGTAVKQRHVFFVPGYDPLGPRRYRELYRKHSAIQAEISGYDISIAGRTGDEVYGWDIAAAIEGASTTARYEVLGWGEIVRASMKRNIAQSYLLLARTLWLYVSSGALFRLLKLRPTAMIAALYPVVMLVFQALVAIAVGVVGAGLLAPLGPVGSVAGGIALFVVALMLFRRNDRWFYAYYLLHDYAFSAQFMGRTPPVLEAQLQSFVERIEAAMASDVDEVLVVGHSSGAHLAVSMVADVLRRQKPTRARQPVLSLLTLGQVIPMISFLPAAGKLRRDLNMLSRSDAMAWIDVSAPGDGGSFALCDPVHVTGVAPPEAEKRWPKVLSAKFSLTLLPETLKRTRWQFFRRPIQYLCAFDRPQEYDFFRITAGPATLEGRFAWRGATQSRQETPLSPYRDF